MRKTLVILSIFFLVLTFSASSINYFKYDFKNSNGDYINNVGVRGWACSNTDCSSVISTLWNSNLLNTSDPPTEYSIVLGFPTTTEMSNAVRYKFVAFHEQYLTTFFTLMPLSQLSGAGSSSSNPYSSTSSLNSRLYKQPNCASPVSLSIVNNIKENLPIVVSSSTNLDATTSSAVGFSDSPYLPQEAHQYFEVETTLHLRIYNYDNVNHKNVGTAIESQDVVKRIYYDDTVSVSFDSWTPPAPGFYNVTVKSVVTDPKCSSNIPQYSSQIVQVWEDYPRNECYSMAQYLSYLPAQAQYKDTITLTFDKLTNYAPNYDPWDSRYILKPRASRIVLNIKGPEEKTFNYDLPANPTNSYATKSITWTPSSYGSYELELLVKANDATCPSDTSSNILTGSLVIAAPPSYPLSIKVFNADTNTIISQANIALNYSSNIFSGVTDTAGNKGFFLIKENYTYSVSKADYQTASGIINLDQPTVIDIRLIQTTACPGIDTATNVNNCGSCGKVCNLANAGEQCIQGVCKITTCTLNYFNMNSLDSDGCEVYCLKTSTTESSCTDKIDNDCDGKIDCTDVDCTSVFIDVFNPCTCTKTNNGVEICNGKDDDCDGSTDEDVTKVTCTSLLGKAPIGVCAGMAVCTEGKSVCTNYEVNETSCDGLDNDCDGDTDEALEKASGENGACAVNKMICQEGKWILNKIYSPVEEICGDNIDNDCDGKNDNGCTCVSGSTQECGSDVGECSKGTQSCINGQWSTVCQGAVNPIAEICDGKDNDCNDRIDKEDGLSECCSPGMVSDCWKDPDCIGVKGKQTCTNYRWSSCSAECPAMQSLIITSPVDKTYTTCENTKSLNIRYEAEPDVCTYKTDTMKAFAENIPELISFTLGSHSLTIKCNEVAKTVNIDIEKAQDCVETVQNIDEDTRNTFLNEGFTQEDIAKAEDTEEAVEHTIQVSTDEDTTTITSTITPKKGVKDFTYSLYIPKCLTQYLSDIEFDLTDYEVIKDDPLIAWHFAEVDEKIELSYKIKGHIDEDCLKQIKGLPIADLIGPYLEKPTGLSKFIAPAIIIAIVMSLVIYIQRFHPEAIKSSEEQYEQQAIEKGRQLLLREVKSMKFKTKEQADAYMRQMEFSDSDREWILGKL